MQSGSPFLPPSLVQTLTTMEPQTPNTNYEIKQEPSIKLSRNSKGYNWEIKILEINIDKMETLNNEMIKRFGNKK